MVDMLRNELAEQALIVGLFNNPDEFGPISELIDPTDFYEPRNEIIFTSMLKLYQTGKPFDPVTVATDLHQEGLLDKIGGITYIQGILDPTDLIHYSGDTTGYALVVKDLSRRRELARHGETIHQIATTGTGISADDVLQHAESGLLSILNQTTSSETLGSVLELIPEVEREIEEASKLPEDATVGIPTGFHKFDDITSGLQPGKLIIIAARPAVGKSTLAVDFGRSAAFLAGKTVLMFSLEMGANELALRILSAESNVKVQNMKKGTLSEHEKMLIEEAKERMKNSGGNFLIDDNPKASVARIRSVSQRQKLKPEGLDMIIIDYLQLMEGTAVNKNATREQVVSEMSRGIKLLTKELQVPIILLAQLNRKSEERDDTRPQVSHLRESGSLEQDADMVLLIHRPEAIDPNNRPGEADLIIGKHRGGSTGIVPLVSMLEFSKFASGEGRYAREPEMLDDGQSGNFAATSEEIPW